MSFLDYSDKKFKKVEPIEAINYLHQGKLIKNKCKGCFNEYFKQEKYEGRIRYVRWYGNNESEGMGYETFYTDTDMFSMKSLLIAKWYVEI